jgi:hypothetical protein
MDQGLGTAPRWQEGFAALVIEPRCGVCAEPQTHMDRLLRRRAGLEGFIWLQQTSVKQQVSDGCELASAGTHACPTGTSGGRSMHVMPLHSIILCHFAHLHCCTSSCISIEHHRLLADADQRCCDAAIWQHLTCTGISAGCQTSLLASVAATLLPCAYVWFNLTALRCSAETQHLQHRHDVALRC